MSRAILSGGMYLPVQYVDVDAVKKRQTHSYCKPGEDAVYVESFVEDGEYICVPRQFGIEYCRSIGMEYDDATSDGHPIEFPVVPSPRDYQVRVIDRVVRVATDFYDFIFRARTGFGKTISSLIAAARLGKTTLVLVDQENLLDQWHETLTNLFGLQPEQIGRIQGKECRYQGALVTLGMVQTLSQKQMPQEVYDYFGTLLIDEVHIAGAPTFSRVLLQFSATHRIGVSATPRRRDGLQKILEDNLGKVRVYVADEHKKSSVYIAYHDTVYSWYANSSPKAGRYLTEVTEDGARTLLAAEAAAMLYDSGRDSLILSDRIEHLTHLRDLCLYMGIPEEDMGLYTGQTYTYRYRKQSNPPRRPLGWERGCDYSPVELKLISKVTPKAKLKSVKEKAKLIFATYQMFSKGVDEPRLCGGLDASPRSAAEQIHGRILRGKAEQEALWITIADRNSYRSVNQLVMRLGDYCKNNAAIFLLNDDGGTTLCQPEELFPDLRKEVARLKSAQIETTYEGLNTLKFPVLPTRPERRVVSATSRPPLLRHDSRTVYSAPAPIEKSLSKKPSTPYLLRRSPSPR